MLQKDVEEALDGVIAGLAAQNKKSKSDDSDGGGDDSQGGSGNDASDGDDGDDSQGGYGDDDSDGSESGSGDDFKSSFSAYQLFPKITNDPRNGVREKREEVVKWLARKVLEIALSSKWEDESGKAICPTFENILFKEVWIGSDKDKRPEVLCPAYMLAQRGGDKGMCIEELVVCGQLALLEVKKKMCISPSDALRYIAGSSASTAKVKPGVTENSWERSEGEGPSTYWSWPTVWRRWYVLYSIRVEDLKEILQSRDAQPQYKELWDALQSTHLHPLIRLFELCHCLCLRLARIPDRKHCDAKKGFLEVCC